MKNTIHWWFILFIMFSCAPNNFESVEETYPDGNPKVVRVYRNDSKEILLKESQFYNDGSKYIEGSYKDGERNGMWTSWYRNGTIWSKGNYKNGKESGLKTVYHENGQKYYEGEVKDEKRVGKWTFWDKEGSVVKMVDYEQQNQ